MVRRARKEADKIQDLEHQLKRALADYANLQRRVGEERGELGDYFKSIFAFKLLPILDSLEAALKAIAGEVTDDHRQGLEIAVGQLKKVLEEEGVEEIGVEDGFDPLVHEATEVVPGKRDNKIIKVVEKGYRLGNKILRPAKVKVEKKKP